MISTGAAPASWWRRIDSAAGGLAADLALYALGAAFAAVTAVTSTLAPHRAWGAVAVWGYTAAALAVVVQLVRRDTRARALLAAMSWTATALLPLLIQAVQRAAGRTDRAQEEVVVVERAGQRLLDHGTPYLTSDAIRSLPREEWLLGYVPYQPAMAIFGVPRALAGVAWWTDARVWFAVATAAALIVAVRAVQGPRPAAVTASQGGVRRADPRHDRRPAPTPAAVTASQGGVRTADQRRDQRPGPTAAVVRAVQGATVLPVCALTLATGGDDLPVLALCLLALALVTRRPGAAGVAAGLAGALKLFAWPVILVLIVHAATRGRRTLARVAVPAVGLPVLVLVPSLAVDPTAVLDNLVRFPLGRGLVTSPAESPLPGHLLATTLADGRLLALGLLAAVGVAIGIRLLRRPPRTAAATAAICAYGMLAAILLLPATRFGYLLYPAAFALWVPALAEPEPVG